MNKSDLLTIVVVSYDGYSDMWPSFFEAKEKFWLDCPFECILANNVLNPEISNVRIVNCGSNAQWSTRTRMAIESVRTKYVCFMLEDFFFSSYVDNKIIFSILDFIEKNNVKYYKLHSFTRIGNKPIEGYPYIHEIPSNLKYGVSLLSAIWERDHFLDLIGKGDYNPWHFEVKLNQQVIKPYREIVGYYDDRNPLNICHMVVQGKYLPAAVKYMRKRGINVDLEKRGKMSWSAFLKYRVKLKVSPYVRKHNIIKRVFNLLGFSTISDKNKL